MHGSRKRGREPGDIGGGPKRPRLPPLPPVPPLPPLPPLEQPESCQIRVYGGADPLPNSIKLIMQAQWTQACVRNLPLLFVKNVLKKNVGVTCPQCKKGKECEWAGYLNHIGFTGYSTGVPRSYEKSSNPIDKANYVIVSMLQKQTRTGVVNELCAFALLQVNEEYVYIDVVCAKGRHPGAGRDVLIEAELLTKRLGKNVISLMALEHVKGYYEKVLGYKYIIPTGPTGLLQNPKIKGPIERNSLWPHGGCCGTQRKAKTKCKGKWTKKGCSKERVCRRMERTRT